MVEGGATLTSDRPRRPAAQNEHRRPNRVRPVRRHCHACLLRDGVPLAVVDAGICQCVPDGLDLRLPSRRVAVRSCRGRVDARCAPQMEQTPVRGGGFMIPTWQWATIAAASAVRRARGGTTRQLRLCRSFGPVQPSSLRLRVLSRGPALRQYLHRAGRRKIQSAMRSARPDPRAFVEGR